MAPGPFRSTLIEREFQHAQTQFSRARPHPALPALAGEMVAYKPGMIDRVLAQGKTVFVDYTAD